MPVYSSDGICINFEIPMKNFIKEHNNGLFSERKLTSVLLWIYLRTTTTTSQKLRLQIQNVNQTKSKNSIINIKYLNDGWNTINITNILVVFAMLIVLLVKFACCSNLLVIVPGGTHGK